MVAYGIAKARAMANRTDWNERTEITKAVITWFDSDYEYELEIENEDRMDNEEFTAWVEENAESLAKADAVENETTFEEIDSIDFTEKEIDDDALFDEAYEAACEFEWECETGRLKLSIPLDTLTARILKLSSDSQSRIEPTPFYSWWEPSDCRADSAVTPVAHKISPDHCF